MRRISIPGQSIKLSYRVLVLLFLAVPTTGVGQEAGLFVPETLASASVQEASPGQQETLFGLGGRFAGDLDGDGSDDIVAQSREGTRIRVWFGDPSWLGSPGQTLSVGGDLSLEVPSGCIDQDGQLNYSALGDINADGFDDLALACWEHTDGPPTPVGAVHVWLGQPQPWASSLVGPDWTLTGADSGARLGASVASLREEGTGAVTQLVVAGATHLDARLPRAWIFDSSVLVAGAAPTLGEAAVTIAGSGDHRCMEPMRVDSIGDFEGDGHGDLALVCPRQPGIQDPGQDNTDDVGWSLFLSSELGVLSGQQDLAGSRSLFRDAGGDAIAQFQPFSALGDLDDDGYGEVAVLAWDEAEAELTGHILRGSMAPGLSFGLEANYPPFVLSGDYEDHRGLQMAATGVLPGRSEAGVWIRWGVADGSRIGLLEVLDPDSWEDSSEPDVVVAFEPGGEDSPAELRRFALGGPGDADGDGVPDLLIFGGHDEGDCLPETCGAFWLILCGDADGDGSSACAGDCDDHDPARSPQAVEVCDGIDHDCDGSDGQVDSDGDGVEACAGDCDDTDPNRTPEAVEVCEDTEDLDCDGLIPSADRDGDGTSNCEDCQPWDASSAPGSFEVCDGLDNDCDGVLPGVETDFDGDGWMACGQDGRPADCDDYAPFVHPGRFEDCENGQDDDCDGLVDEDEDTDGDGVRSCEGDCDDSSAEVFPGAEELCDGLDNDCDGVIDNPRDEDQDGVTICGGDCDDADSSRFPGATGSCEGGVDANCDGADDLTDFDGDGWSACLGDCDDNDPGVSPAAIEFCDGRDNDCSGAADEPFDQDGDGWASCLGDCSDLEDNRFPAAVEPDCEDGVDGDCDLTADLSDSDCFTEELPEPDPLDGPYGLRCDDCAASQAAGAGKRGWLLSLLLLGLARRRRRVVSRRAGASLVGLTALLVCSVLSPNLAQAAKKERMVVVYLASQPDIRGMVAARELLPDFEAVEILHGSELISETSERILVRGLPRAYSCPTGGNPPELIETSSRVLDRLIQLDYRGALRIYEHSFRELPCLDSPLATGVLVDLFYYRGLALLGLGDRKEAESAFRDVLSIQTDYQGDPNFPPESNRVLDEIRQSHRTWPWVRLQAFARPGSLLRVDGNDWDPSSENLDLHPGTHVVQYRARGRTWTVVMRIKEGDTPFLIHSLDRLEALREARRDEGARGWSAEVLGLAAGERDVDLVAVVDLEGSPSRVLYLFRAGAQDFSFDPAREVGTSAGRQRSAERARSLKSADKKGRNARSGQPTRPSRGSGTRTSLPRRPGEGSSYADRLRVRFSLGFAYVHPYSYAIVPVDFSIRLVAGLGLDLGGELGLNRREDFGLTLLPAGQAGLSYRFEVGDFHPRIGALVRLGATRDDSEEEGVGLLVGWAGRLGFDVTPGGGAGLLNLDAQVGMYGKPFFVSVTGGGGFRF